jgi:hypothetical protein
MQMQYSESEFYRQRAISQRDFNISVARNEYDYQLSRKRATEDHNFSLKQIMLSGDALAYYYSQRQFEIDKRRAEEDYQLQKKRASEDFDRQQGDALAQFNISRAFQKKMFEISRADQLIDFNIQRKRAAEQFQIQRQDAEYQYSEMARLRQQGWTLELLATKNTATQIAWYRHRQGQNEINTMKAIDDFALASYNYVRTIFGQMGGSGWSGMPGVPSYDTGGYTKGGLANTHNGEFVMNADTTKAAEKLGKTNRLTQESIVSAMTGGGMNYVDNRTFSRGLTADEKQDLRQELRQMVMEAYN